jgi:hypothetical protein
MPEPSLVPGVPYATDPSAANDPFLTHTPLIPRSASPARQMTSPIEQMTQEPRPMMDVNRDPFLTHEASGKNILAEHHVNLAQSNDPFLTHQASEVMHYQMTAEELEGLKKKPFNIRDYLGEGDPERKKSTLKTLAVVPFLVYLWVLLLWLLMRHYSYTTTVVLTFLLTMVAIGCLGTYGAGRSSGRAPIGTLGILLIFAVAAGVYFGDFGWDYIWRQYWWTQTGYRYDGNSAETPANARMDASVVGFKSTSSNSNSLVMQTLVDTTRSAGYKNGDIYCVAPVLSPPSIANGLARVNFWAIGINCCQTIGSFTCDDTRTAIAKAEALHGLVSAAGALSVRWVDNPDSVEWQLAWRAVGYVFLCVLLGFPAFFGVAWLLWYKGIGRGQRPGEGKGGINLDQNNDIAVKAANLKAKFAHARDAFIAA